MSLYLVKSDITKRKADAILCVKNTKMHLKMLETYDAEDLEVPTIITGLDFKAHKVIHCGVSQYEDASNTSILRDVLLYSLNVAIQNKFESIEIPISMLESIYPGREDIEIATRVIDDFLKDKELSVGFVADSDKTFYEYKNLFKPERCFSGEKMLYSKLPRTFNKKRSRVCETDANPYFSLISFTPTKGKNTNSWKNKSGHRVDLAPSFKDKLFAYLSKCGKENAQVWKDGGIDRKLFSKIISSKKEYFPKKSTIFNLIIGMELNIEEAEDLLESAGYCFSHSLKTDNIIRSFIEDENYNVREINDVLNDNNLPLIG